MSCSNPGLIFILILFTAFGAFAFEPLFDTRIDYAAGIDPRSVFAADLDGDGHNDLAVTNAGNNYRRGSISILLNSGNGTLQSAVEYDAGYHPNSVFAVDLDGDSDNDLAIVNGDSDNVSILLNNGYGTFQTAINYAAGDGPRSIFAADLDGDGDNDLIVDNWDSDNVLVLLNNGNATFQDPINYGVGEYPNSVFAVDLDGDTDNDLAVANAGDYGQSGSVSILLNEGDGTFHPAVNYTIRGNPNSVFAADLDGDGDNDLAVANSRDNYHGGNISVLQNNGDGTFQQTANYGIGRRFRSVFAVDFDSDGDNDLAVANIGDYGIPGYVAVLQNNGNGTFQDPIKYGAGHWPYSVFGVDLDGDGYNDLAVANRLSNNVSVLLNNDNGTFQEAAGYNTDDFPESIFAVDLDDDGDNDLAAATRNNVSILLNNGNGTFQEAVNYTAGNYSISVFSIDLDADKDNDLAVANINSDNISVFFNNGDGSFQAAVNYGAGNAPKSIFAADFDGDGNNDLVTANFNSNNVSVLLNNGEGVFQAA
jgi:hypothetical protein